MALPGFGSRLSIPPGPPQMLTELLLELGIAVSTGYNGGKTCCSAQGIMVGKHAVPVYYVIETVCLKL